MKHRFRRLLIALLILALPFSAAAQTDPLDALLAGIPASAFGDGIVSYADYAALVAARPGARPPESLDDVSAYLKSDEGQSYSRVLLDIAAGFSSLQRYLMLAGEMLEVSGINPFALGQTLEAGFPPRQQIWLQGGLDLEAIRLALSGQEYERLPGDGEGIEIWCEGGSCVNGQRMDLARRNPAFIPGGDLGRRFPVMLMENRLAMSPDPDVFLSLSDFGTPRLAELPQVAAVLGAARVAAGQERLSQLLLIQGGMLAPKPAAAPLPEELIIAQADTPDALLVIVSLAYAGADDAAAARAALAGSVGDALLGNGQALMDLVKRHSGSLDPLSDSASGDVTATLVFRFPPASRPVPGEAAATPFHTFAGMAYMNGLAWLAP